MSSSFDVFKAVLGGPTYGHSCAVCRLGTEASSCPCLFQAGHGVLFPSPLSSPKIGAKRILQVLPRAEYLCLLQYFSLLIWSLSILSWRLWSLHRSLYYLPCHLLPLQLKPKSFESSAPLSSTWFLAPPSWDICQEDSQLNACSQPPSALGIWDPCLVPNIEVHWDEDPVLEQ